MPVSIREKQCYNGHGFSEDGAGMSSMKTRSGRAAGPWGALRQLPRESDG